MVFKLNGLVRFCEKLKTYLQYHNAYGHQTWMDGDFFPENHMAFKLNGLVRLREKLKTYLHYHSAYGQETWHGGGTQ